MSVKLDTLPEFLTAKQAYGILKISKSLLAKWCALGIGPPCYKFGRRYRFRKDELISWIDAQRQL